jgi:flagellar FliL protein
LSAKSEAADAPRAPAKSKKMLIIILGAVLVLALGGGGAFFYISKQRAAAAEGEDAAPEKSAANSGPKKPPAYLPLDNMVVNLADPGGERVAQIGITLEVLDAHAADTVKAFLPTIRSGVLMLISQRTSEELLVNCRRIFSERHPSRLVVVKIRMAAKSLHPRKRLSKKTPMRTYPLSVCCFPALSFSKVAAGTNI